MSDLAGLLEGTRRALRIDAARGAGRRVLAGSGTWFGVDVSHRLEHDDHGRFVRRIEGRLSRATGFDGDVAWESDSGGATRVLELDERETLLLATWVQTGFWLSDDAPIERRLASDERDGDVEIVLRVRGGAREARLAVDRATSLPKRISAPSVLGPWSWSFEGWREVDGVPVPARLVQALPAGATHVLEIASASRLRAPGRFGPPGTDARDAAFDTSIAPRIGVERAPTGHLLVRPRVAGRDVGWFVLDTGAAVPVISPPAADAAGLPSLGRVYAGGAGATTRAALLREGVGFELGPIEIGGRLFFTQMDLAPMAAPLGRPIAGVIGWDLFARASVAIDMSEPRVEIFDPAAFRGDDLEWQPVFLHGRHPHVRARVEGAHEGLFRLDTGGGGAGLFFHTPAVERLGLLAGREGTEVGLAGAGGAMKALQSTVTSFELAGVRLEDVPAFFVAAGHGAFDDPYSLGTIAGAILGRFTMVLDYPRRRIAFIASGTRSPAPRKTA